jgi:hypothetical protein
VRESASERSGVESMPVNENGCWEVGEGREDRGMANPPSVGHRRSEIGQVIKLGLLTVSTGRPGWRWIAGRR